MHDTDQDGWIQISYEQFLTLVFSLRSWRNTSLLCEMKASLKTIWNGRTSLRTIGNGRTSLWAPFVLCLEEVAAVTAQFGNIKKCECLIRLCGVVVHGNGVEFLLPPHGALHAAVVQSIHIFYVLKFCCRPCCCCAGTVLLPRCYCTTDMESYLYALVSASTTQSYHAIKCQQAMFKCR